MPHDLVEELGVLQGCKTWILQNSDGKLIPHSVSAGLDYAAIGPNMLLQRLRKNRVW